MAMITQSGVDLLTRGTRAQFAAENKARQRKRRLAQAASGNYQFDPRDTAVEVERLRQQQEDLNAEGQGVRDRYATDPVFGGPTQLFDASNIMDLPAGVLQRHGRMGVSEMVKTEKDRVNGGGRSGWTFDPQTGQTKSNGWTNKDEYAAGEALGSSNMMDNAMEADAQRMAPEIVAKAKIAQANASNAARADRARNVVAFDQAVASGNTQANNAYREELAGRKQPLFDNRGSTDAIRSRTFGDFGDTGGTINKGGETFMTAPGTVGVPKYRAPQRTTSALSPVKQSDSFMPRGIGQTYEAVERPDPYAGLESMPRPVIDRRYRGAPYASRTGAKAYSAPAQFDPFEEARKQKARFGGY